MNNNNLGEFLKEIRESNNSSLRDFANQIGISHTYLQKLESGIDPRSGNPVSPTIDTLESISKSLNIGLDKLLLICGYIQGETSFDEYAGSTTTNYYPSMSKDESSLINKYQKLDDKGKHTINTILNVEYDRCTNKED